MTDASFRKLVTDQANKEIKEEKFKEAVAKKKKEIQRPWHIKLFPWKLEIKIKRRSV